MRNSEVETRLELGQGAFELQRLPRRKHELLRAWDAADEYLLAELAAEAAPPSGARLAILNDAFGALALALHAYRPQLISDSWLAHEATRQNARRNGMDPDELRLLSSLQQPEGTADWLLIKVPKSMALLHEQLHRLQPCIGAHTRVIAAGMVKTMPSSLWSLLETLVGLTTTSLARKKARLVYARPDPRREVPAAPYPICYTLEPSGDTLCNHANVFSRERLDIGTRFFLQHLPRHSTARDIIDLGCGNGVLGLMAARAHPEARLYFVDESFMAVDSAEENFRRALGAQREAQFHVGDGLNGFADAMADLILCNPPFHQQHAIGDQIALGMFQGARRVLRPGGELWVVGNRHLGYHRSLKRIFGNSRLVASNKKFVILAARA